MVAGDVERFRTHSYPGRGKAMREINVSFEVSGRLITRPVDVGVVVRSGETLGAIDPDPYMAYGAHSHHRRRARSARGGSV